MSSLNTTRQIQFEKPTLNHTSLYRFSEMPTENTTLKHFKNYLDTFKEPLEERHSFGRKYFISRSVDLQRRCSTPSKRYENYERMVSYSVKKHQAQKVEEIKSRKNQQKPKRTLKRISNLNEIVTNNMTAELISQNIFLPKDQTVQQALKDNTSRSQLFDQIILVDRLLQIRKEAQTVKETRRMKCIEDHSKHFHLNERHRDINAFYRRKYVKQNLTFHFQHKIAKFQTTKLRKRTEENRTLMKNIMNHYSKQVHLQKDIHSNNINETIKRLFLHYSREGSVQDSYMNISSKQLQRFFVDFDLQIEGNIVAKEIAGLKNVSYHEFVELIYSLRKPQLYNTVQEFLKEKVMKKQFIYVPTECSLYEQKNQEIDNALKAIKVQQRLQNICKKTKKLGVQLNGVRWLNFDDFHELMLLLKIYPTFVSKKKMKFYFLYCESSCNMIRLQDVQRVIGYISMDGEQSGRTRLTQLIHLIRQYRV